MPPFNFDFNQPLVILPARLKSSRLPLKMTLEVAPGLPLIVASALNAKRACSQVLVATDSPVIGDILQQHNIAYMLTPEDCASGTDRLAFVVKELGLGQSIFDDNPWIINVQGDEPLLEPSILLELMRSCTLNPKADIITVAVKLQSSEEWTNPNCVKAVTPSAALNTTQPVLYFSRSAVPFNRDNPGVVPLNAWRHIGVYAYQARTLARWPDLAYSLLEDTEKLEQWRAIENGLQFKALTLETSCSVSVDCANDLQLVRSILANNATAESRAK